MFDAINFLMNQNYNTPTMYWFCMFFLVPVAIMITNDIFYKEDGFTK